MNGHVIGIAYHRYAVNIFVTYGDGYFQRYRIYCNLQHFKATWNLRNLRDMLGRRVTGEAVSQPNSSNLFHVWLYQPYQLVRFVSLHDDYLRTERVGSVLTCEACALQVTVTHTWDHTFVQLFGLEVSEDGTEATCLCPNCGALLYSSRLPHVRANTPDELQNPKSLPGMNLTAQQIEDGDIFPGQRMPTFHGKPASVGSPPPEVVFMAGTGPGGSIGVAVKSAQSASKAPVTDLEDML